MTLGIGYVPDNDDRYAYLDIPARWTDEFPITYRLPARPTHRGLAIRAERQSRKQWFKGRLPLVFWRKV